MDNAVWWILQRKQLVISPHHHYLIVVIPKPNMLLLHSKLPLKFFLVSPPCLEVLGKVLQFGLMCRIWANMRTKYLVAHKMLLKHVDQDGIKDTGGLGTFSKISSMPRFLRLSWLSGSAQWWGSRQDIHHLQWWFWKPTNSSHVVENWLANLDQSVSDHSLICALNFQIHGHVHDHGFW